MINARTVLTKDKIGWKAAWLDQERRKPVLIKLRIPKGAVVIQPKQKRDCYGYLVAINESKKCRTDRAIPISIHRLKRHRIEGQKTALADRRPFIGGERKQLIYHVGRVARPLEGQLNQNTTLECAEGIHFFEKCQSAIQFYHDIME